MIKKELFMTRSDGVKLYRTWSDAGVRIRQIPSNLVYDEAIDVETAAWEYEETDELIKVQEEPEDGDQ